MSVLARRRGRTGPRADGAAGALGRYLGGEERILLITRQHPLVLLHDFGRMLQWFIPVLLLTWGLSGAQVLRGAVGDWMIRGLLVFAAGVVLWLMQRLLVWEFERVVVTTEKVILVSGVLARRIASTPLTKVSEFAVHQSLLGRIAGFGSLIVDVPGGREQTLHGLTYIPDPTGVYRLVSDQGRRMRRDEGGADRVDRVVAEQSNTPASAPLPSHVIGPGGYPVAGSRVVEYDLDAAERPMLDHTIQIDRPDILR